MENNEIKTVTITEERYDELIERSNWLDYLEMAGVDNWEGYSYAIDMKHEQEGYPEDDE